MLSKPLTNLCLFSLILLLAIQLTGLSCLDEWRSLPSHASLALFQAGTMVASQLGDDGCPCHLAFVSVPKAAPESCYPIALLDLGALTSLVPDHTSLPFHPPLTL